VVINRVSIFTPTTLDTTPIQLCLRDSLFLFLFLFLFFQKEDETTVGENARPFS
jgi:hypothetical protein